MQSTKLYADINGGFQAAVAKDAGQQVVMNMKALRDAFQLKFKRCRTGASAAVRAKCTCSCDIRASVSTTSLVMLASIDDRN